MDAFFMVLEFLVWLYIYPGFWFGIFVWWFDYILVLCLYTLYNIKV